MKLKCYGLTITTNGKVFYHNGSFVVGNVSKRR